jgi:hypothetical protein
MVPGEMTREAREERVLFYEKIRANGSPNSRFGRN